MEQSIWEKESFFRKQDIVIVGGGGLVGIWSAFHLKKNNPKARITIMERGIIPTGASTRNAGFACFGSVSELLEDASRMGVDKMKELVEMRWKGLQQLRSVVPEKKIDFSVCGGYDLFRVSDGFVKQSFAQEMSWLNNEILPITGKKNTFRFSDDKIRKSGMSGFDHMVENRLEGSLHSGKLCQYLSTLIQGMGVQVLTGMEITAYEENNGIISLQSNHQIEIQTQVLLICTNAFAAEFAPELDLKPARGQILLTGPIPDLLLKGTYHFDQGYYYFRNLGKRVLLGGARHRAFEAETTLEFGTTATVQEDLEKLLRDQILPGLSFQITDRWSGIMAMGSEKLPLIRQLAPSVFCAVRMSGMGLALAPLAGEKISKMIGKL